MSASFSVQYIFRLLDQFSGPSRALATAARTMAKPIHAAGQAANAAASGLARYGHAAAKAASQVNALAKSKAATLLTGGVLGGRGGRGAGGAFGMLGMFGGGWMAKSILDVGKDASAAENKFRSLVDSVTGEQMSTLKSSISTQMRKTGEGYSDLMSAAADAAQIVGSADMATSIMQTASSLAQIDTAGKDTAFFAEALAALLGPDGDLANLRQIGDQLAKQQKLGAGTAGGTIEAYKNVAAMEELSGADPAALMTAIGLIKNFMPSLRDSEIGNMAKYGLRFMTMPKPTDIKSMGMLGLNPNSFLNQTGAFDVAKTQALLFQISKQKGGIDKIKKAFSGKNVLAGQFWLSMLGMPPEQFKKYYEELVNSAGALDASAAERTKGMEGVWNRLSGVYGDFKRGLAKFTEPVTIPAMSMMADALDGAKALGKWLSTDHPVVAKMAAGLMVFAGAASVAALPLAILATSLRAIGGGAALRGAWWLAKGLARLGAAGAGGAMAGIAASVGGLARATTLAYRFAGALGALKLLSRAAFRLSAMVVGFETVSWIYDNWSRLKALLADPINAKIIFPEMPSWLATFFEKMGEFREWMAKGTAAARGGATPFGQSPPGGWSAEQQRIRDEWMPTSQMPGFAERRRSFVRGGRRNDPDEAWFRGHPNQYGPAPAVAQRPSAALTGAMAEREISVRTSLDPIQVNAPAAVPLNVNVTVSGQVNGPVTGTGSGSGSLPLSVTAPRGRATADPAAPVAP